MSGRRLAGRLGVPGPRLFGFLALAVLATAEWSRMVGGLGLGLPLEWVGLAVLAGAAVRATDGLPPRRRRAGRLAVGAGGLLAALPASGLDSGLLRPARWDELLDGIARAAQALLEVPLPYAGADPWPALALQLLGALLCVLAGLLTFWPREGHRGYPFFAFAVLMVLAAAPVVSLGGSRSFLFSGALAALAVCFLWLERLPLRPGLGVTALVLVALVGAQPLAGAADRDAPWFDVKDFAASAGPQTPARFDWQHSYGPIDWPRDGREVLRVRVRDRGGPEYWKATTLDGFDGETWVQRSRREAETAPAASRRPAWTRSFDVTIRLLRSSDLIGPGTILGVSGASRAVRAAGSPGRREAASDLRRGDVYRVRTYTPKPRRKELASATAGAGGRQAGDLVIQIPLRRDVPARLLPHDLAGDAVTSASVRFEPFGASRGPRARYPDTVGTFDGAAALDRSPYARTWHLAQRLRRRARTPAAYVKAVDRFLHGSGFSYTERPATPRPGVAPLDGFLFDSRRGYCQHYSGAMALLLRMGGVPARVASGFSPGGYSPSRRQWLVRDTDAHSWVEAWFDPFGWVTFDPTPADTPARSLIAAAPETSADQGGDAEGGASRTVGKKLSLDASGGGPPGAAGPAPGDGSGSSGLARALPWALAFAALVGGAALVRRRRRRAPRPVAPLDRAIAELEAAVGRAGRPAPPGTTLHQLEQRFTRSEDAMAYVRALRRARYSRDTPGPTAHQRRAVRRELARGRGWPGRLRALWALPPGRTMS